jgi:hypothetical protein
MGRGVWVAAARWLVLAAMLIAGLAEAGEVAGVKMPDTLELEGRRLALAHMALKEKLFFNLYVWGLYMEEIPQAQSEAIASNRVKRLHFRFLRTVRRDQLVGAMRHGLSRSTELQSSEAMQQDLEKLLGSLRDVSKGDNLVLTYVPDSGLHVSGEASGGTVIQGKAFADTLFAAWLQKHPVFPR